MGKMKKQFIKRLEDHNDHLNPFDFAKEISVLYMEKDSEGIKALYDAYLRWFLNDNPNVSDSKAEELVRANLSGASKLADIVNQSGYEASGQLLVALDPTSLGGSIYEFYRESIGIEGGKEQR